mmetsp:Transcript_14874/g.20863  ORF Transcript_14874/g.20863 Transcript_14874/m.20863 type:complete len:374 (+) Transcript_14874:181-1302(+)
MPLPPLVMAEEPRGSPQSDPRSPSYRTITEAQIEAGLSVASSEQRARQAVAAAQAAAQASPASTRFVCQSPLSPTQPVTLILKPPGRCARLREAVNSVRAAAKEAFRQGRRILASFQWQQMSLISLGLASFICLLIALGGSAGVQPFAAALAALLGWLVVYAYQLQVQCQRLVVSLALIKHRVARAAGTHVESEIDARLEADLTSVSSAYAFLQGADSRPREAVQAVLTASLVNDYLRLQALVRAYTERYGTLVEGRDWHMDKTLAAAVLPPGPDVACHTQRTVLESLCEDGLSEAASRIGELREFPPAMSPRDVNFESPDGNPNLLPPVGATPAASSSAAPPSSGMADTLSKTIASIEDSMNLPSWLRQIRH